MTNYEKNKKLLDVYAAAKLSWGVDKYGKIFECYSNSCGDCIFNPNGICPQKRITWLQQEYKESEVDWTKVEVDTPILVKSSENSDWMKRYFAGYMFGKVCAFNYGCKSECFIDITCWNYAKLAESEE